MALYGVPTQAALAAFLAALLAGTQSAQAQSHLTPSLERQVAAISVSGVLRADLSDGSRQPQAILAQQDLGISVGRSNDLVGTPIDFSRFRALHAVSVNRIDGPANLGLLLNQRPLMASTLTSGFGQRTHPIFGGIRMHSGVDLAAPLGTPIYATGRGVVSSANWRGGYGLLISIEHAGNVESRYGHLSQIAVRNGETVERGEIIGFVGSTGNSTGPHLHYEVRQNGTALNPLRNR